MKKFWISLIAGAAICLSVANTAFATETEDVLKQTAGNF